MMPNQVFPKQSTRPLTPASNPVPIFVLSLIIFFIHQFCNGSYSNWFGLSVDQCSQVLPMNYVGCQEQKLEIVMWSIKHDELHDLPFNEIQKRVKRHFFTELR